jgi:hypothetical protein
MSRRRIVAGVVVGALALGSIAAEHGAIAQDRAQHGRQVFMEKAVTAVTPWDGSARPSAPTSPTSARNIPRRT